MEKLEKILLEKGIAIPKELTIEFLLKTFSDYHLNFDAEKGQFFCYAPSYWGDTHDGNFSEYYHEDPVSAIIGAVA